LVPPAAAVVVVHFGLAVQRNFSESVDGWHLQKQALQGTSSPGYASVIAILVCNCRRGACTMQHDMGMGAGLCQDFCVLTSAVMP
jgi:hypothetical protein